MYEVSRCVALGLLACYALAQEAEKPAGIVTSSNGAQVRPTGYNAARELARDDYVFPGDTILTELGDAEITLCSKRAVFRFPRGGEFNISANDVRARTVSPVQIADSAGCDLPPMSPDLASARRRALVHEEPEKTRGLNVEPAELPWGRPTRSLSGSPGTRPSVKTSGCNLPMRMQAHLLISSKAQGADA